MIAQGFAITLRNAMRNRRRSVMTLLTISIGCAASLLVGSLLDYMVLDFQTSTVRRAGHLTVFRAGYYQYGAGNPSAYAIKDYTRLMRVLREDPQLSTRVRIVTPVQHIAGVAGNFAASTSKTFFGEGIVPGDRAAMRTWDEYGIHPATLRAPAINSDDAGNIGFGMARILGLCSLGVPDCAVKSRTAEGDGPIDAEMAAIAARTHALQAPSETAPKTTETLDLIAATATGAPNVVSMRVARADFLGIKDLDDNYITMALPLAQRLQYGSAAPGVTGLTLQLASTSDVPFVRARLDQIFKGGADAFEVRDFIELTPLYKQVMAFFRLLFWFVAVVLGTIVLFTTSNTMTMSVMERTSEIGTARALGEQVRQIMARFIGEGMLLGVVGAVLGLALTLVIALAVNQSGLMWTPPTTAGSIPLKLYPWKNVEFVFGVVGAFVLVSTLAAVAPAARAARMNIVDALRHV